MKIKIVCEVCKNEFERRAGEVNRNAKRNRKIFCSRTCAGKYHIRNIPEISKKWNHLNPANQRDEFTPFRCFLNSVRRRDKEFDVTLEDLKSQWETQSGVCPYTGWNLLLKQGKQVPNQASLDRIDSSKGYVKGNIQFVAYIANIAKSSYDDKTLFEFCKAVTERTLS